MRGIDLSNFTKLPPDAGPLASLLSTHDVGLAIIQANDPPAQYPPSQTADQFDLFGNLGVCRDGYGYLWFDDADLSYARSQLNVLGGRKVRRMWADLEDVRAFVAPMPLQQKLDLILRYLDLLAAYQDGPDPPGFYTGKWWIDAYLAGDTSLGARGLDGWLSIYDYDPNVSMWTRTAGLVALAIKQYAGSSSLSAVLAMATPEQFLAIPSEYHGDSPIPESLDQYTTAARWTRRGRSSLSGAGVSISGIDLDSLSDQEAQRVQQYMGTAPTPTPDNPCQDVQDQLNGVVNSIGYIAGDLAAPLRKKGRPKYVRDFVAGLDAQADQHGISHP